ncbi:RES domain-containing protein [Ramlibacter henchirensis]|uniref:RES domain-containing protein n=1 Tax=Ramlibacter henchirensis TaxID=204072 RepID=A0A4Z0C9B5_9BURK|nr:RES family NAD+ phosphorylase [Ramlibacter henchirensis]TFZ06669.1 RES domain-containing protein [Ramlibacter henchirensis]
MLWDEGWFAFVRGERRDLWRGVEAQHRVATMRLADTLQEQELLEQLLDASKPRLPPRAAAAHYLLFTPFRYVAEWPSRFRRPEEAGAWYGADECLTVAAEIAHWRWKFFMDSDGLRGEQLVTEHTFFQARFSGIELDITQPPWNAHRERWRHGDDYSHCHALAARARSLPEAVQGIRYESARREGGLCQVVFDPAALSLPRPNLQQTWVCKTTRNLVMLSHERESIEFAMPA